MDALLVSLAARAAHELEKRVNAIALLDGAPKPVQEALKEAREAIADLRAAYDAGAIRTTLATPATSEPKTM